MDLVQFVESKLVFITGCVLLVRLPNGGPAGQTVWEEHREEHKRSKQEITDLADVMHNLRPCQYLFYVLSVTNTYTKLNYSGLKIIT